LKKKKDKSFKEELKEFQKKKKNKLKIKQVNKSE